MCTLFLDGRYFSISKAAARYLGQFWYHYQKISGMNLAYSEKDFQIHFQFMNWFFTPILPASGPKNHIGNQFTCILSLCRKKSLRNFIALPHIPKRYFSFWAPISGKWDFEKNNFEIVSNSTLWKDYHSHSTFGPIALKSVV